jgi:hypothetical protein
LTRKIVTLCYHHKVKTYLGRGRDSPASMVSRTSPIAAALENIIFEELV